MREIKFRAWDKMLKRWCRPQLTIRIDGNRDGMNEYVLMQYTGLKDKNGVEIYEGDIVNVHSYTVTGLGKVGFNKGSFVFNKFEYPTSQVLHSFSEIEVIGNIYENPELLENN